MKTYFRRGIFLPLLCCNPYGVISTHNWEAICDQNRSGTEPNKLELTLHYRGGHEEYMEVTLGKHQAGFIKIRLTTQFLYSKKPCLNTRNITRNSTPIC